MQWKAGLIRLAFFCALIGTWEMVSRTGLTDPDLLPPAFAVFGKILELMTSRLFLGECAETGLRVVVAFVIAAPIALICGFIFGENRKLGDSLSPVFNVILAVPQSIFLPIFILLLGLGFMQKVAFGVTHVFFVVAVATMSAVRQVPANYILAARSFGADRWRIYRSIYLPAMAPQVMNGLRIGLIFDIIGILLAEMYGSRNGVGVLIFKWGEAHQTKDLMAGIVFVSIATITVNEMMRIWESRFNRWKAQES